MNDEFLVDRMCVEFGCVRICSGDLGMLMRWSPYW